MSGIRNQDDVDLLCPGVISRINLADQTVTLEKPFQNGLVCKFPSITLTAPDIEELKILKSREELESEAADVTSPSVVQQVTHAQS